MCERIELLDTDKRNCGLFCVIIKYFHHITQLLFITSIKKIIILSNEISNYWIFATWGSIWS